MWHDPADERSVRYLLGGLTVSERAEFEASYLRDDSLHEQLLAIECELIDAYLDGELSAVDQTEFQKQYLTTPAGRERVDRGRRVLAFAAQSRPEPPAARPSSPP